MRHLVSPACTITLKKAADAPATALASPVSALSGHGLPRRLAKSCTNVRVWLSKLPHFEPFRCWRLVRFRDIRWFGLAAHNGSASLGLVLVAKITSDQGGMTGVHGIPRADVPGAALQVWSLRYGPRKYFDCGR